MIDILIDTILDSLKILPFLFVTYLIMEYIEHKMSEKSKTTIKKAGKWGPLLGSAVGIIPQCGFSASATNLYSARVISLGTLLAVYLSTSDEMIPIFISEKVIAGPFHPAFREQVESGLWYDVIVNKIKKLNTKVMEVEVTVFILYT